MRDDSRSAATNKSNSTNKQIGSSKNTYKRKQTTAETKFLQMLITTFRVGILRTNTSNIQE